MAAFVKAIQGHRFEAIYLTMLFTGLRRGEACGLTWDCVDLDRGTILINKQLQNVPGEPGNFRLVPTKNSKGRLITAAASVAQLLRRHRAQQLRDRLKAGPIWRDTSFVFCNEVGCHLSPNTIYHNYKRIVASIGIPDARLHDLRHPNVKPKTKIFSSFLKFLGSHVTWNISPNHTRNTPIKV